jgi:glucokinase
VPKGASAREVFELTAELSKTALAGREPRAIGAGVPGIVAPQGDRVLTAPNIRIAGFPLAARLKARFKSRAVLGNDVSVGLFGEAWRGAARGKKNVIGLFPGTGLGGGAIVDGKILHGAHGAATEFGHIVVVRGGRRCGCGKRGCLEAYSSRSAIEKALGGARMKSKAIKKALSRREWDVVGAVREASEHLADAAVSLRQIFDPELIILGGGLIEACSGFILPIVRQTLDADPFFGKTVGRCPVKAAALGDDAIVVGAARLASLL